VAAAAAYEAADHKDNAEAMYRQAISLEPTLADTYVSLARLYAGQGRLEEEQALYEQGLAAAPTSGTLYVAYAESLLNKGDQEGADDLLVIAEQVSPKAETLVARAAVYSGLREYDAVMRDLQAAVQKEPGNLEAMIALGDLHRDLGDTKKAQHWYAEASKLSPGIAAGRLRLSRLTR
jgi:tetratricopeptide (TPR) repeat protein